MRLVKYTLKKNISNINYIQKVNIHKKELWKQEYGNKTIYLKVNFINKINL